MVLLDACFYRGGICVVEPYPPIGVVSDMPNKTLALTEHQTHKTYYCNEQAYNL